MFDWLRSFGRFLGRLGNRTVFRSRENFDRILSGLRTEVFHLSDEAGFPRSDLPTFGATEDFARPHIEVDKNGFHFVVVERGQELERKTTRNRRELIYWIFESVSFSEAIRFEAKNRIEGEDFRRQLFARQEQQLGRIDPGWEQRLREKHDAILSRNPFRDSEE